MKTYGIRYMTHKDYVVVTTIHKPNTKVETHE